MSYFPLTLKHLNLKQSLSDKNTLKPVNQVTILILVDQLD